MMRALVSLVLVVGLAGLLSAGTPSETIFDTHSKLAAHVLAGLKDGDVLVVFADKVKGVRVTEVTQQRAVITVPNYFTVYRLSGAKAKTPPKPDPVLETLWRKKQAGFKVMSPAGKFIPTQVVIQSPPGVRVLDLINCASTHQYACTIRYVAGAKVTFLKTSKTKNDPDPRVEILTAGLGPDAGLLAFTDWSKGLRFEQIGPKDVILTADRGLDFYVVPLVSKKEESDLFALQTRAALDKKSVHYPFSGKPIKIRFSGVPMDGRVVCSEQKYASACLIRFTPGMDLEFKK